MDFKGVLVLSDSFFPVMGGREMVIHDLMTEYKKMGVYSVLGTTTFNKLNPVDDEKLGYSVIRCKGISFSKNEVLAFPDKNFKKQIEYEIKSGKINIIHTQTKYGLAKYALKLGKKYNIPVVTSVHTDYESVYKRTLKFWPIYKLAIMLVKRIINRHDGCFTVSEFMKNKLQKMGIKHDIKVVPNGINFDSKMPENADIQRVLEKYNIDKNTDTLIFIGRIHDVKAIDVIIESLAKVKSPFKMVFIGGGEIEKYKKLADNFGVQDKCQFVGEIRNREEIKAIISFAKIQVYPSISETFGLTIRECAKLQTPSIVTKGMATAEPIKDRVNGFITDGSPEEIARVIDEYLNNLDSLKKISEEASKTIGENWESSANLSIELYEEFINKKN